MNLRVLYSWLAERLLVCHEGICNFYLKYFSSYSVLIEIYLMMCVDNLKIPSFEPKFIMFNTFWHGVEMTSSVNICSLGGEWTDHRTNWMWRNLCFFLGGGGKRVYIYYAYSILVGKPDGKRPLERPKSMWEGMDLGEQGGREWTGFIWLRTGTSGGPLRTR
jgi:hypothetical protein